MGKALLHPLESQVRNSNISSFILAEALRQKGKALGWKQESPPAIHNCVALTCPL